tara:strand:+ start:704 stop:1054 length:351 start_codon:yes stop_codon:yes gene_type:complete
MAIASGKFSYALCDYCGQRYPYTVLRKNWRGFMVCPDDYEVKAAQLMPLNFKGDAIALQNPRPDRIEPVVVYLGVPADSAFNSIGSASGTNDMRPYPQQNAIIGVGSVGDVSIVIS